jgi:flavin-binding protein dodecin
VDGTDPGNRDEQLEPKGAAMAVARVTEISATSTQSFEDAIRQGVDRANDTLRNVKSAWIKEQQVRLEGGSITEYQVNMLITFVLDS